MVKKNKSFGIQLLPFVFLQFAIVGVVSSQEKTDHVLIEHEGAKVTVADFDMLLLKIPENQRESFILDEKRVRQTLANLFVQKKLVQEAKASGADKDGVIAHRVQLAAEKELANLYLAFLAKQIDRPDFEALANEEYIAGPDRFVQPEMVRVAHILVVVKDGDEAEAAEKLADIQSEMGKVDIDFAEIAKAFSDDPTAAQNGGDLGYFTKGKMAPAFEQKAFSMTEPNEISEPIKTQFGYHIIKFLDRKAKELQSLEEVKPALVREIEQRHYQQVRQSELQRIRSLDGINVSDEGIRKLQSRPATLSE